MDGDTVGNKRGSRARSYKDRKRYFWLLSLIYVLLPLGGIWGARATGYSAFYWLPLIVFHFIFPVLDHVIGVDKGNPPESAVPALEADPYYRWLPMLTVPLHFGVFFYCAWYVATQELSWHGFIGLALSTGWASGLGINTGHELGHKRTASEKWLSKIVLSIAGYGHFFTEHNRGHHHEVATPEDSASSRYGENIYQFMLREWPGGVRRAWQLESRRLRSKGKSAFSLANEVLQPLVLTAIWFAALIGLFGAIMVPFLVIQSAYAWWLLTMANFTEHYGLLRARKANGRFEKCLPKHSWNSNYLLSNLVLFHLQRHSDHHAYPARGYQTLRDYDDVPTMPSGYPLMFTVALFPPLWRFIMDDRVLEWAGGDRARINMAR